METEIQGIISKTTEGDRKALARAITLVENEIPGYEEILLTLKQKKYTIYRQKTAAWSSSFTP